MSVNDAPSPEELPPAVQDWIDEHPEADAGALEEVWRLSGDAEPEPSFDPERVAALRDALDEAMQDDRLQGAKAEASSRRDAGGQRSRDRAPAERERRRRRVGWTVGAVLVAALVAVVAYTVAVPVRITAPPGQVRATTLPDGSQVELNSETTLRYPQWWRVGFLRGWVGRSVQLDGEAFFKVTDTGTSFCVETENATVRVLGTRFNVWARRSEGFPETRVVVAEGRVALSSLGRTTRLDSAQAAIVRGSARPSASTNVHVARALAWRDGGFSFQEASIRTVSAELERRFDIPITVQAEVQGRPITLHVDTARSPGSLLRDVCSVAGCRVDSTQKGLIIHSR